MKKLAQFFLSCTVFLSLMLFALPGSGEILRVLDCTLDLPPMEQGAKTDGESDVFGDGFTVLYSYKNKFDYSEKTFDDGYYGTQRLNFGGKTQVGKGMINTVRFTAENNATLKFWWVSGGDGRQFALYDESGEILMETQVESVKNNLYISSFDIEKGTYYLGVPEGSNYLFKIELSILEEGETKAPRTDWAEIAAPVLMSAQDTGKGEIEVTVSAQVGHLGADHVTVTMFDAEGSAIDTRRSLAEKDTHTLIFEPDASGDYTFSASVQRENETEKAGDQHIGCSYILPLASPSFTGIHSAGGGMLRMVWAPVPESTGYEVFSAGESLGRTSDTSFTSPVLPIGERHHFTVRALRKDECGPFSEEISAVAAEEEQRLWSFSVFGPSTNEKDNGVIGSLNEDGFVTVYSENGKGKIQPNADDGVSFYYTAIPAGQNFSLRARVHADGWKYSNGQEGFGLMAMDSVPPSGADSHLTNQYLALASKVEYYWQNGKPSESGIKYTMRLGLGALAKIGYEPGSRYPVIGYMWPLEYSAASRPIEGVSNYNAIGNNQNPDVLDKTASTVAELTDFILEIEKNNTGYFITYYGEDGSVIGQYKEYDPDALSKMDPDYVYAGFFAARNARATFSDVQLTVIDPAQDAAAEERPFTYITPALSITSAQTSSKADYTVSFVPNCPGTARIKIDGETVAENISAQALVRNDVPVTLPGAGEMLLEVVFTPDETLLTDPYTRLASDKAVYAEIAVTYTSAYAALDTLYVTPAGAPSGRGTQESPLNLSTAVLYARPGQTILLSEGIYNFVSPLRIPQGVDGTEDAPIRMVAAPDCASRPVLDFKQLSAGVIHGGDHWYFEGFDVCNTQNNQKGFQVSGHHNVLSDICTYHNGNTGIQISRYAGSDPTWDWPHHNLILNCTSWGNADAGYEDADGFAAKLTCGEGNVFDGCVAYRNADDGFDLYAKPETGPIGRVIIRNSVAYENGYLEDGTEGGNGNGFKLGGSNIPGGHLLENSYAFFNKAKGIDANSCPDVQVQNCISYNNLHYNVAFYTNQEQDTAYAAQNLISLKDPSIPGGDPSREDELKPRGNQNMDAFVNDSCYYWDGNKSVNASGDRITAEHFRSLTFEGVRRHEDGSIDLGGFLQLKDAP